VVQWVGSQHQKKKKKRQKKKTLSPGNFIFFLTSFYCLYKSLLGEKEGKKKRKEERKEGLSELGLYFLSPATKRILT
jgi:hypothetical protein